MGIVDYENAVSTVDSNNNGMGTIYLTGGGYVDYPFRGWGKDSVYGWQQMVWKKAPTRGGTFAFTNIDDIDVGLVARCEISTEYMNIHDYEVLNAIINRERHFSARFYDPTTLQWVTRDVYCSDNQKKMIFSLGRKIIGMQGISVKLVGTNLDEDSAQTYTITYIMDESNNTTSTVSVKYGAQVTIKDDTGVTNPNGGNFVGWSTNSGSNRQVNYRPLQSTTIWGNKTLYPVFE